MFPLRIQELLMELIDTLWNVNAVKPGKDN